MEESKKYVQQFPEYWDDNIPSGWGRFDENGGNRSVDAIKSQLRLFHKCLELINQGQIVNVDNFLTQIPSVYGRMHENGFNDSINSVKYRFNAIYERIKAIVNNLPPPESKDWDSNLSGSWGRCAENGGNACIEALKPRLKSLRTFIEQLEKEKYRKELELKANQESIKREAELSEQIRKLENEAKEREEKHQQEIQNLLSAALKRKEEEKEQEDILREDKLREENDRIEALRLDKEEKDGLEALRLEKEEKDGQEALRLEKEEKKKHESLGSGEDKNGNLDEESKLEKDKSKEQKVKFDVDDKGIMEKSTKKYQDSGMGILELAKKAKDIGEILDEDFKSFKALLNSSDISPQNN